MVEESVFEQKNGSSKFVEICRSKKKNLNSGYKSEQEWIKN